MTQVISKTGQRNTRFEGWNIDIAYKRGDTAIYEGSIYSANEDIPAGTSFIIGTVGATWQTSVEGGGAASEIGAGTPGNVIVDPNGVVTISAEGVANVIRANANGVSITGNLRVANVGNFKLPGGANGQFLQTDGTGNLAWADAGGSSNGNSGITTNTSNVTMTIDGNTVQIINANGTATTGNATVTGNITANGTVRGNVIQGNTANFTGNVIGGNIQTTGTVQGNTANFNTLTTSGANLGTVGNLKILGGSNGQFLRTDGAGNLAWADAASSNGNSGITTNTSNVTLEIDGNTIQIIDANGTTTTGNANISGDTNVAGNITANGTVTANLFTGNGSGLTNITAANIVGTVANANFAQFAGNVTVNAQPNITAVGTLTSLSVAGVTQLGANANVRILGGANGQILSTDGLGNLIWTSGATTGGSGVVPSAGNVAIEVANTVIQTIDANGTTTTGNANVSGNITANGTITGNTVIANTINTTGNIQSNGTITGNTVIANTINTTGTITANSFTGNATGLSNIPGANVIGIVPNANFAAFAGNVTVNAQPNITSVGTLANLNVTANVNIGGDLNVIGNLNYANVGQLVVSNSFIYIADGNPGDVLDMGLIGETDGGTYNGFVRDKNTDTWRVFSNLPTQPTTVVDWANTTAGNFAAGNTTVSRLTVSGQSLLGAVGNVKVTGGSTGQVLTTDGTGNLQWVSVSAAATSNFSNFAGNVLVNAQPNITSVGTLTSLAVTGTANLGNVANVIIRGGTTGQVLSTDGTGNLAWTSGASNGGSGVVPNPSNVVIEVANTVIQVVDANGTTTTGNANVSGNITANGSITGNTIIANTINTTGTITANSFTGNANGLSNIQGANVVGNVPSAITANFANFAGNVTVNAQPNITSVGTLTSLTVTGNVTGGNLVTAGTVTTANLNATGSNVSLGFVSNVRMTGGTTGQFLQTDGSGTLSWATVSLGASSNISNGTSNVSIDTLDGNVAVKVNGTTNVAVFSATGANFSGTANVVGNLSAGNITTQFVQASVILANIGISTNGDINATANIYGGNILGRYHGDGGNLSNIQGANVTGNVTSAVTANFANFAGNITVAAQPNITSVGTLASLTVGGVTTLGPVGNVKVTGGTTGQFLQTDGTGNLAWSTVATGVATSIANGTSNIGFTGVNGNILFATNGNSVGGISTDAVVLGDRLGATLSHSGVFNTVAIGTAAGRVNQNSRAVAIGGYAGENSQGFGAVAIGFGSGQNSQGSNAISIGHLSSPNQNQNAIAIGVNAVQASAGIRQAASSIVINATNANINAGETALYIAPVRNITAANTVFYDPATKEMTYGVPTAAAATSIANGTSNVGFSGVNGNITMGVNGNGVGFISLTKVVLGDRFSTTQSANANTVSIGAAAGLSNQGGDAIAIGANAGEINQGPGAVAIGVLSAVENQGSKAIAIGYFSSRRQAAGAIAIGANAVNSSIGNTQAANSIVINATNSNITASTASAFYVAPIRNASSTNVMYYDATTKEVTYSGTPRDFGPVNEAFQTFNPAGGTMVLDCSIRMIMNVGGMTQNSSINLTNLTTPVSSGTVVTVFLNQGATAYMTSSLLIAGTSQTIRWQGGVVPTGNANKLDVVAFTILRTATSTYVVTGQMVSYG